MSKFCCGLVLAWLSVLRGPSPAEGVPHQEVEISDEISTTEFVVLASYFWPNPAGIDCCEWIAPYDRCYLWDGYCTSSPILACERCRPSYGHQSGPPRRSRCCCLAMRRGCQSSVTGSAVAGPAATGPAEGSESIRLPTSIPAPQPTYRDPSDFQFDPVPESQGESPTPATAPVPNPLPRNVIPTSERDSKLDRVRGTRPEVVETVRSTFNSVFARAEMEPTRVKLNPPTGGRESDRAPNPPEPQFYDYHYPRSLRDAVRSASTTPLGAQLEQLGGTMVR